MDQGQATGGAALRKSNYVTTAAYDNAHVIQGDVYINPNERETELTRQALRRQALHTALNYDNRESRQQQLSLPRIPVQSFEWIWSKDIPLLAWLQTPEPFFWIKGKPGSGKSTLMNYLSLSFRTTSQLGRSGQSYVLVAFFFDFRAGSLTANSIAGLVKVFLSRIAKAFPDIETFLAEQNAYLSLDTADLQTLVNLFCDGVRAKASKICALIDGLDEYRGGHQDLINTLMHIQDRTNMKMLFASRPETAFNHAFATFPGIQMQDHNAASVRVYIDDAISRGRQSLAQVDAVFDQDMRAEIMERAEGVIIWARLAVDALLRAAQENSSQPVLRQILDQLPGELEEMYDYTISRHIPNHQSEAMLTLFLINLAGGTASVKLIYGLWHFCSRYLVGFSPVQLEISGQSFVERSLSLVGSFVDYNIKNKGRRLFEPNAEVRLMHKTVQAYLHSSQSIKQLLPLRFQEAFPNNVPIRLCSQVVAEASDVAAFGFEDLLRSHLSPAEVLDWNKTFPDRVRNCDMWAPRDELLKFALRYLRLSAKSMERSGLKYFSLVANAFSSWLMISESSEGLLSYCDWSLARQHNLLDLYVAMDINLPRYAQDRLSSIPSLNASEWSSLLVTSLSIGNANPPLQIAAMIAPQVTLLSSNLLILCASRDKAHLSTKPTDLLGLLSPDPEEQAKYAISKERCAEGTDLVHWWIISGHKYPNSFGILEVILQATSSIDAGCGKGGPSLHFALNRCKQRHVKADCPLYCFRKLANYGADPMLKHQGLTAEELATSLRTSKALTSTPFVWRRFQKPAKEHVCDFKSIEEACAFYSRISQWPTGFCLENATGKQSSADGKPETPRDPLKPLGANQNPISTQQQEREQDSIPIEIPIQYSDPIIRP